MQPVPPYPTNHTPFGYSMSGHPVSGPLLPGFAPDSAPYPQDIRPLITRHRLRRQRRRKAATLLTGASIAFGVAAFRTPSASADGPRSPAHAAHDPHATHHRDRTMHQPVSMHPAAPD